MPSIATQTHWSWLQDLAEIERLALSSGDEIESSRFSLQRTRELEGSSGGATTAKGDIILHPIQSNQDANTALLTLPSITTEKDRSRNVTFPSLPPDREDDTLSHNVTLPPISVKELASCPEYTDLHSVKVNKEDSNANITSHEVIPPTVSVNTNANTALHEVISPTVTVNREDSNADTALHEVNKEDAITSDGNEVTPALLFQQLEQADYSDQEESDQLDNTTSSGDDTQEESDAEHEMIPDKSNLPLALESITKLPWPTILQYVRESTSAANQYFSLDNKSVVERRTQEARTMVDQNEEGEGVGELGEDEGGGSLELKRDGSLFCHFCGRKLPRRNLLAETKDIEKMKEQDYICCPAYKEYTVLVAVCMRQTVEKMRTAPPEKIVLKPRNIMEEKKLLEEKALVILRRKQRREEVRKKREREAEARRTLRGMKTIQFSLDPSEKLQEGWAVKQKPGAKNHFHQAKKAAKRRKTVEDRVEMFSAGTLERLKALALPRGLERRFFECTGKPYLTILPDKTGYCNYPSGRKAVVIFSLYEGALAYMVYEDSDHPQMLACVDELGRSCCYYLNGKVRFLCTPQLMLQFDAGSQTRRKLKSCDAAGSTLFQPVSIPLNKHITFKCNQESTSLTLSFTNDHIKFTTSSKLHKDEEPHYHSQLQSTTQATETILSRNKSRISQLLHLLQNISQIQKLSKLETVYGSKGPAELYGTPMSKGPRNSHNIKRERESASRKRTRSTGTILLKKASTDKHNRAMTIDLT